MNYGNYDAGLASLMTSSLNPNLAALKAKSDLIWSGGAMGAIAANRLERDLAAESFMASLPSTADMEATRGGSVSTPTEVNAYLDRMELERQDRVADYEWTGRLAEARRESEQFARIEAQRKLDAIRFDAQIELNRWQAQQERETSIAADAIVDQIRQKPLFELPKTQTYIPPEPEFELPKFDPIPETPLIPRPFTPHIDQSWRGDLPASTTIKYSPPHMSDDHAYPHVDVEIFPSDGFGNRLKGKAGKKVGSIHGIPTWELDNFGLPETEPPKPNLLQRILNRLND